MFSILQRYIYRQLLAVFAVTLCGFTLLMLVYMLLRPVQSGVPPRYLLRLIPLALPYALGWTLPISLLAACVVTYGRMSADNELTAVRAAGIHLFPVILPAVLLGLLFSTVGLYVNDDLSPASSEARRALVDEMTQDISLAQIMLEDPILEFGDKLKILAWDVRGEELRDVVIHLREGDRLTVIRGKSASLSRSPEDGTLELVVSDGNAVSFDPRHRQPTWARYDKLICMPDTEPSSREKIKTKHLTTRQLEQRLRAGGDDEHWQREARVAIHTRRSVALSSLCFVLIGVPLGILARKGSKLTGFGLAVLVMFVLYYPLLVAGKALCREGMLPAWVGMWLPNAAVTVIGLVLLISLLRK